MRYFIEDIEAQIVGTLKIAYAAVNASVDVRTHAGEITKEVLMNRAYMEGVITKYPFVYTQFTGADVVPVESKGEITRDTLTWALYFGSNNINNKRDAQIEIFQLMRVAHDQLQGVWTLSAQTLAPELKRLDQVAPITTPQFNQLRWFTRNRGRNNRLIVNFPHIVVFRADYSADFMS